MPSPDTLTAIGLAVAALLLALAVRYTEPGGLSRMTRTGHHAARWLDAHEVPAAARYGPYDDKPAVAPTPTPVSALETVPDPVSPFAARTA